MEYAVLPALFAATTTGTFRGMPASQRSAAADVVPVHGGIERCSRKEARRLKRL